MALPVTVLALFQAAAITRFTRSAMLDNLPLDYVRTARSKGLADADGHGSSHSDRTA